MPIQVQIEGRGDLELEFPDDTPRDVIDKVVKEHVTGKRDSSGMPTSTVQAAQNANGQRQTTQVAKSVEPPLPSLRDVLDRSKPLPKSLEQPPPSVLFGSAEKPTFLRSIFSQPLTPDNKPLPTMEELNVRAKHDAAVPPMWKVGSGIDKDNKSPSEVLDQGLQFENLGVSQKLRELTDKASDYPFLQNVGKAVTGVTAGVEDLATGLTTPNNLALVGGAAKLAKASPKVARGLSGLFALDMAGGFVDSAKQLAQAMESGDVEGMARAGVHGAGSALFGVGALRHLAGRPVIEGRVNKTEPPVDTDIKPPSETPVEPTATSTPPVVEPVKTPRPTTKLTPPNPPPEAFAEEVAAPKTTATISTSPPTKPLWEMSFDELQQLEKAAKEADRTSLDSIFGLEGAKRYRSLERTANSTLQPYEKTRTAAQEMEAMEAKLTEQQRQQLYGVGETGPTLEDLSTYRRAVGGLDWSSPEALGQSLQWAVTKVGKNTDPAKMTPEQQVAYAQLKTAYKVAAEAGWDPRTVSQSALQASEKRFSRDPEDVELMLGHFMPKKSEATPKQVESRPVSTDTNTVDTADALIDQAAKPYEHQLKDIPKDPPINPATDIYLGSGLGSLQSVLSKAFSGQLSNGARWALGKVSNAIKSSPSKLRDKFDTAVEETADYTLGVRQTDEAAGLRMSNPKDLNESAWVAFRSQPGSVGAALGWAHDVSSFIKKQNKELRKEYKKIVANNRASGIDPTSKWSLAARKRDRDASMKLLEKSKEWAQLQSLERDITDPNYEYPSFPDSPPNMVGTKADVIRRRQVIEQEVGPQMTSLFEKQASELLTEYRKILHSILVEPYFDLDVNGKPRKGVGLMSQEQFDKMTATRQFYAPVQRNLDTIENDTYSSGGRMSVPENTATKKMKQGSKAPLKPLIPSMINELTRSIILANKNHAARKLASVGSKTGLVKQVKPGYTPRKANGVPVEVVFNVMEGGVRKTYMAPPELRIAIDRLDKHQFDILTEALSSANELYRAGVTLNPSFMTNNVPRDLGTSFFTDPNPHGIFAIRYIHGMLKGLTKEVDFLKTNQDYIDFLKYFGGGSGVKEYLTGATTQKGIDRLMQEFNPTIPQQVNPKRLWRGYQHVGEGLEVGPRLMAARNSKLAGENPYLQAWRGRNITVDFATHGAAAWAATAKKALPFVNARLQGTRNMLNVVGESMKELPGLKQGLNKMGVAPTRSTKAQRQHVATGFGTLSALAISAFVWNTAAFPELYDEVSDWVKEGKLFWLTGEKDEKGQPKTHGINIPIQDVAWFVELINGSLSYLVSKHPEQYKALVKKFYPKLEMPDEIVKFNARKHAANAIGSLLPITVTKGGELSTEEMIKSLQIPLVASMYTLGTGYDVRHNKEADMGMPGERRQRYDQYTSPTALLMSRGLNKALDVPGIVPETTPMRSAPVLQAAGEQLAGPLWFRAGDSLIRSINERVTPTNALSSVITDPQTEMGGGKEKPGLWDSAFVDSFRRAKIGPDSDEMRKRKMYQDIASNTSSLVTKEARKLFTDIKKGEQDKARLRLDSIKTTFPDKKDQDAFYDKVADLITMEQINADIKQYNTTAKHKIPEMSEADARFARADVDARAMYILDGIQSRTSPDARAKFIEEMKVKKILNKNVYGALGRIIEQQQQQQQQQETTTPTTTTP